MTVAPTRTLRVVFFEGPGTHPLPADLLRAAMAHLLDEGFAVARADCLCQLAPAPDQAVLTLGHFDSETVRTLESASVGHDFTVRHIHGMDVDEVCELASATAGKLHAASEDDWGCWFPAIDRDRCSDCGKCLSFCLFGVYRKEDGRVVVAAPAQCKPNCPACARVCPNGAIVFPKYVKGGPIAGDESAADGDPVRVDLSGVAKKDLYDALRARSRAPRDACDCLSRLEGLDVPPEVLAALRQRATDEAPASPADDNASTDRASEPDGSDA